MDGWTRICIGITQVAAMMKFADDLEYTDQLGRTHETHHARHIRMLGRIYAMKEPRFEVSSIEDAMASQKAYLDHGERRPVTIDLGAGVVATSHGALNAIAKPHESQWVFDARLQFRLREGVRCPMCHQQTHRISTGFPKYTKRHMEILFGVMHHLGTIRKWWNGPGGSSVSMIITPGEPDPMIGPGHSYEPFDLREGFPR